MAAAAGMVIPGILYMKDFESGGNINDKYIASDFDSDYIQHFIVLSDLENNDITRGEVIGIIQKMTFASFEIIKQHWYYCRREKLFP